MLRWTLPVPWLALTLAWLVAACGRTLPSAVPATPLPAPLASNTPRPTLAASPAATALAVLTATSLPTVMPASPTPWPTVQTATPIYLPDLEVTATAQAVGTNPPRPPPPTLPPATASLVVATVPSATSAPPPSVTSFTIAPAEILPGQPVTLTWQANAQQVTVQRVDTFGRLGEFFSVGPSGSLLLSTPPEQRGQVMFVLFASTGSVHAQATVLARILCPDTWFFANPPPECPASPPHGTVMQAQNFERGQMLWTQYNDRLYILYADGGQPRWDVLANAWFAGQPESDPSLTPPAAYYQPVRGFGVAWRTGYVSPVQVVRDRLGWATNEEYGLPNAFVQCDSLPKYSRCYLTGPGAVVYVLRPERSGWEVWAAP